MLMIKSLLLAAFMFASVLAGTNSPSKPAMATLEVQSNFDFSLTRREFRVHYSGLGNGYSTSENVYIKIYKRGDSEDGSEKHSFHVINTDEKKIYQFALEDADVGKYEVAVCAGKTCSDRNPALTDINSVDATKITCNRVEWRSGQLVDSGETFSTDFFGPIEADWIAPNQFGVIEGEVNQVLQSAGRPMDYQTDYTQLSLTENPQYKHAGGIFFAAVTYEIARFKELFDKLQVGKTGTEGTKYAHEFCERKYLLSAHAHIVEQATKEVKHRFKTTLFLSEGGKRMYVLSAAPKKVHVEMTHKGVNIQTGTYDLWITFCATEKDVVESTFCAEPLIKRDFKVIHDQK